MFTQKLAAHVLLAATALMLSNVSAQADDVYTPTMKDMMSIQATLHNYRWGLERQDNKKMASAFTEDGVLMMIGETMQIKTEGREKIAAGPKIEGAPPASSAPSAGQGAPAPGGGPPAGGLPMGETWHFATNDYFEFESPTRAKHYGYWITVSPAPAGSSTASIGNPGHYDDILEKQKNGDWLIKERKIVINKK